MCEKRDDVSKDTSVPSLIEKWKNKFVSPTDPKQRVMWTEDFEDIEADLRKVIDEVDGFKDRVPRLKPEHDWYKGYTVAISELKQKIFGSSKSEEGCVVLKKTDVIPSDDEKPKGGEYGIMKNGLWKKTILAAAVGIFLLLTGQVYEKLSHYHKFCGEPITNCLKDMAECREQLTICENSTKNECIMVLTRCNYILGRCEVIGELGGCL